MCLHEDSKMKAAYKRKSSTLCNMKDAIHKLLGLDMQQYELCMNFFVRAKCFKCVIINMDVAIFIQKQITNSPIYKSPLFVDTATRVPRFENMHCARTVNARFSYGNGSN